MLDWVIFANVIQDSKISRGVQLKDCIKMILKLANCHKDRLVCGTINSKKKFKRYFLIKNNTFRFLFSGYGYQFLFGENTTYPSLWIIWQIRLHNVNNLMPFLLSLVPQACMQGIWRLFLGIFWDLISLVIFWKKFYKVLQRWNNYFPTQWVA